MSEKPQHKPDVSRETSGAPGETPGMTDAELMLHEILDRAMPTISEPPKETSGEASTGEASAKPEGGAAEEKTQEASTSGVSRETPEPEKPSPPPPAKNKRSSVYVYLAVMFAAAFLMLLLAYFVQQRNNNDAMDNLRSINTASRQELLEEIEALEKENESLQKEVDYQKNRVEQIKEEREQYRNNFEDYLSKSTDLDIKTMTLQYFWYIGQFMENKDYPMAAAAVLFQADSLRSAWNSQISINTAQTAQYEAYRQELIDRGYLEERPVQSYYDGQSPTELWFTAQWEPSTNEDMAALCSLWCALNAHFVTEVDNAASQYLYVFPLGSPNSGYQKKVEQLASSFTLEQFQLMKEELAEDQWIEVWEDGTIINGPGPDNAEDDINYSLPFNLPESASPYLRIYGN